MIAQRKFAPWIGNRYSSEGIRGKRVLILGESHYGVAGGEYETYTQDVIRDMALKKSRLAFFPRILRVVAGGSGWISDTERQDFWNRVVFYNFVQTFVGAAPRIRPTPAMWLEAREPFLETIKELAPQAIVVLGRELSRNLPAIPSAIKVFAIPHPSSVGFKYEAWHSQITAGLNS